ncbi:hypothetical protein WA026_000539 [Henosepilachna vigintioctopunctata]|uniref:Tetratricopeptide SHNi-TPR domain-containing protein n=1 Tax=Henosepilachna vigintioctopunctata TaxID=420089 RepID=A0AAW1V5H0_9CUCU
MADVVVDPENKNARNLLTQGIRAYVLQDYNAAVQALGKASELMVADTGDELDDSLGEVYFYYGKALLASSRQESGPLGNIVSKDEENEDSEGDDEKDEEVENDANDEEINEVKNEVEIGDDVDDVKPDVSETITEKTEKEAAETTEEIKTEDTSATGETVDESEDPSDLQLAWEVMELAKKIFENRGADGKRHLAETLTTLGEISMESENFKAAIKDIEDGLVIQEEIFSKDSRKVAETCYNLGVAYSTDNEFEKAIKAFEKSLTYLNERISVLEKQGDGEEEIKEIKELIPELKEKISEMENHEVETKKTLAELASQPEIAKKIIEGATSSSSSKQASDISHLVKRKRKAEDKDEDSKPAKITK